MRLRRAVMAACCLPALLSAEPPDLPATASPGVERSIKKAVGYLLDQIGPDGRCPAEYPEDNPRFGGKTLLTCWALISSGVDYRAEPRLRNALRWCLSAELKGTYPTALRCLMLSALKDGRALPQLRHDAEWLLRAANDDGTYSYNSSGSGSTTYDNSNTYWAAMGVRAAQQRGVEVPARFWQRMETHWLADQQPDGGWGYQCRLRSGRRFARSYGSMTAAGVATLSMCFAQRSRRSIIDCEPIAQYRAIRRGTEWLGEHFSAVIHPRKGQEYFYHWLLALQRVGALTGRKYLAGHDWYAEGTAELLRRQHDDGSFSYGENIEATSLAVLFLVRGGAPILLSKFQYDGTWNTRPRDAGNLSAWLGYTYERPLGWQVVDEHSTDADWDDGRIVYLSGAGPIELNDEQIRSLREFVFRGGLILSEAACNRPDFTIDMHRHYQRMFPRHRLEPMPPDHPVRTLVFGEVQPDGLMTISNGIRPLVIHAPKQLSLALEAGPDEQTRPVFNMLANLYLLLTDKGSAGLRGQADWHGPPTQTRPSTQTRPAGKELRLGRLRHRGNDDPEPLALQRLAASLKRRRNIDLIVGPPLPAETLSAEVWPVVYVTGTGRLNLLPRDVEELRRYVRQGGTILADAAGGSEVFDRSFRSEVAQALGNVVLLPRASRFYLSGPNVLREIRYRRGMVEYLPADQRRLPRLEAVFLGDRPAVIFSRDDLTAGLIGYPLLGLRGYAPDDARRIMTNLIVQASASR